LHGRTNSISIQGSVGKPGGGERKAVTFSSGDLLLVSTRH
jgi:hypothetical protein